MQRIYHQEKCMGCGLCNQFCPTKIIEMSTKRNKNNYHTCHIVNPNKCTNCKICELQCPYGAIEFINADQSSFPKLLENIEIPFHSGCFQGLIEKQLARVIEELKCIDKIVIFKNRNARFALQVETIQTDDYIKQAIAYQKKHLEKLVILFLVDEEPWQHTEVIEEVSRLNACPITIIHMLNYFSNLCIDPTSTNYACDLLALLMQNNQAQYSSRNSFTSPNETRRTTSSLKKALLYQMQGKGYNLVEIILPCHLRLENYNTAITHKEVKTNMDWFINEILCKYPLKIYQDKE